MVTLYHLNHSCRDFAAGFVINLVPIQIIPCSAFAEEYQKWQDAFPDGLSVFGIRHMTPDQPYGEVPEEKLQLEWECECVRRKYFGHLPSRYQGFFALASLDEAITFREGCKTETRMSGQIWEIEAERIRHRGDMRLLTPERCNEANLRAYWEGKPLEEGTPIWECMVVPPVKMIRCVLNGEVAG